MSNLTVLLLAALLALLPLAAPRAIHAHAFSPVLFELSEDATDPGLVHARWTTSLVRLRGSELSPALPARCQPVGQVKEARSDVRVIVEWTERCAAAATGTSVLAGATIAVTGLPGSGKDVLLRLQLADGRSLQAVLRAESPAWTVPLAGTRGSVARGYFTLGARHIAGGLDHLLFVFGLLLLVTGLPMLVKTVTAFTLGHSITLSLAVVGLLPTSSAWIEPAIAASILVLAVELTRPQQQHTTLMHRRPWLAAAGFGLLHGLGFAGALAEVGLPGNELVTALFSFNLGIEAGQLAFVLAVLAAQRATSGATARVLAGLPPWASRMVLQVPVYALGCLSVYWLLQRSAVALGIRVADGLL
ncbi:MAG: HupE/UreJ family protein [Deltaproteobacteria bacterium]|nr:HupE/UreJ family protein [Deltaproteobacteria bacterium]